MYTLGINAAFHDTAACLVKDGQVVSAAEEERFTRIKHGKRPLPFTTWELPFNAIDYCLGHSGIELADIDHVAYSYDPYLLLDKDSAQNASIALPLEPSKQKVAVNWVSPWEPLALAYVINAERQLIDGVPHHLRGRYRTAKQARRWRWHFVEHHLAHEASAFLAAPFDSCAVLTLDGRGERATTSYGQFSGRGFRRLLQIDVPDSLGLLYEAVTSYLGFLHSSDEYKVMALASYGSPHYLDEFRDIVRLEGEGRYTTRNLRLEERFGPARQRNAELLQRHFDIARSLQEVLEERVIELARWLRAETEENAVAMAGGVALNCVMNGRLRDAGIFDQVWVQPAAGDAGTALGAALWIDWKTRNAGTQKMLPGYRMDHAFLGPEYSAEEIETFLKRAKLPYRRLANVAEETAELLAQDKIVGWFQGRMEFGPRALGARSILASPLSPDMQQRLNEIKDREDFRPVAPAVLEEEAARWFQGARVSPFMLFIFDVAEDKGERIPAVRHVDGTARVQTVNRRQHPLYYDLLKAFQQITGVPVLVNTSFNTRSEPIVCSPRDAIECFWTSPLDALVIGPFMLEKSSGTAQTTTRTARQAEPWHA
ncbi:MAG TPA: carbamoyltransferase C-terminal domain-containing protein [Burkholderiales bacterium]|nr:carbamoyltransferase C-terminal domain-containing protein [Burkholderiales bacterium]